MELLVPVVVLFLICRIFILFSIGEGNGNLLQISCLENPVDRGTWWAAVRGVAQSQTRLKWFSMHACIGEGNGSPLQCSCLENPRDRGASWAATQGAAKSRTQLITHALNCHCLWDLFPNQESNPSPWQWKRRVLTIGPPRNSPTLKKNWLLNWSFKMDK